MIGQKEIIKKNEKFIIFKIKVPRSNKKRIWKKWGLSKEIYSLNFWTKEGTEEWLNIKSPLSIKMYRQKGTRVAKIPILNIGDKCEHYVYGLTLCALKGV